MKYVRRMSSQDKREIENLLHFIKEWKIAKKENRLYDNRVILPRGEGVENGIL